MSCSGQGIKFAQGMMELIRKYPRAAAAFFMGVGGTGTTVIQQFFSKLKKIKNTQEDVLAMFHQFRLDFEAYRREDLRHKEEMRRESLEKFSALTIALYQAAFGRAPQGSGATEVIEKLEPEQIQLIFEALKIGFEHLQKGAAVTAGDAEEQI